MSEKKDSELEFDGPNDGRGKGVWQTNYPKEARVAIYLEATYLGVIFISAPVASLLVLNDFFQNFLITTALKKYSYAWFGGTFGGVLFAFKWLYHSVATNMWNEDRRLWRIITPHISGGLAFAVAVLISSGMLNVFSSESLDRPSAAFGLGFLVGYFSDSAIGKLREVARTIFGTTERKERKKD